MKNNSKYEITDNEHAIVFTGHFDLGEKLTPKISSLVDKAGQIKGKPLVLVGDIAFRQKVITYIQRGIKGLILFYQIREALCESYCVFQQLPRSEAEILNRIDTQVFSYISSYLQENQPVIFGEIKSNQVDLYQLDEILAHLAKDLIIRRLHEYGYEPSDVLIVREKQLRNMVKRKVKPHVNPIKTWVGMPDFTKNEYGVFIDSERIVNSNGNALCRGIMLMFFELIWNLNCEIITFVVDSVHIQSIQKAYALFENHLHELPYLRNHTMKVNYVTI
jgi:hypothetical protein